MGSPFYFFDLTGRAFKMGLPDVVAERRQQTRYASLMYKCCYGKSSLSFYN
jgi:hypothetical protein